MKQTLLSFQIDLPLSRLSSIGFAVLAGQRLIEAAPVDIFLHRQFSENRTRFVQVLTTKFGSLIREVIKFFLATKS